MRILQGPNPEQLTCVLSDEEFVSRAHQLAVVCQDIEAEEARQTQIKADMKAAMTHLEAEQSRLSLIVARKAEVRPVEVTVFANDETGEAFALRRDTGEVLRRRPLTNEERQLPLPVGDEY